MQSNWKLSNPNGGDTLNYNPMISINTITIGGHPSHYKKIAEIPLTEGDENQVMRNWESYYNKKINDTFWEFHIRIRLILCELNIIREKNRDDFCKIYDRHSELISILIKSI